MHALFQATVQSLVRKFVILSAIQCAAAKPHFSEATQGIFLHVAMYDMSLQFWVQWFAMCKLLCTWELS